MSYRDPVINIQIRLPRWSTRTWLAVGLLLTTLAGAVVYAGVPWTPFAGGEKLTSTKMNANLQAMADAITALQGQTAVTQPHLILNQGNVDLGIYLGTWQDSTGQPSSYPVIFYSPIGGPLFLNVESNNQPQIRYTGANCTGTPYSYVPIYAPFSNAGYENPQTGTIFQTAGLPQPLNGLSYLNGNTCMSFNVTDSNAIPLKDTKVPNLNLNLKQTSIQLR